MMFRFPSLFWKIFIAFWVANALVLLATTLTILDITEAEKHRDRHRMRVLNLSEKVVQAYESGIRPEIPRHLRRLARGIRIENDRGDPVFDLARSSQVGKHREKQEFKSTSGQVYRVYSRLPAPQRIYRQWLASAISVRLLFILVASGVVSFVLGLMITRPLERLRQKLKDLAAGNLQTRAEIDLLRRRDEIGALARQFDEMAVRIDHLINSKQRLLQDISHELRAPLARLQVAAALARQKADNQAALTRIEKDCDYLSGLIDEILDFAHLSEPVNPGPQPVMISKLINQVIEDCRFQYPDVQFMHASPDHHLSVVTSPELLLRSLGNILRNAARYTGASGIVDVHCDLEKEHWLITVRDHGPGVSEDQLEKLVLPFYRVENDTRKGYGLGLSIACRCIELLGGELTLENHREGGLVASIRLPMAT